MKKESIIHLDAENGQASKLTKQEKVPMTDERLEIILHSITKDIIIVLSFWLAREILKDADVFKAGFLSLFAIIFVGICLTYLYWCRND